MQALQNRHSSRNFADKQISDEVLSTLLWAADGVNRPESGKLTAPSASNAQDIRIYVIRKDGAYLYIWTQTAFRLLMRQEYTAMAENGRE